MKARRKSTMADVRRAKAAFDEHRDRRHAVGMERCLIVRAAMGLDQAEEARAA